MTMANVKRITLSYREEPVGGDVRAQPDVSDERAISHAQHLVLLIHGYNNDAQAAREAYDGFHARQHDLDNDDRYGIGRTFVEVYWPGDAAWGFASFLFYMGSIKHSIQTAERFADYLGKRIGSAVRIDIVAHSMGSRLATELLRALESQNAPPQVGRIIFMAGAVPTFMLEQRTPSRRLRPSYDRVLREGARSLYSGSDAVLAFAFPAGQSLAPGAEGFLPTALGHAMWIDPTAPHNLGQLVNQGAGHSDYWGWNTKPKPLRCATFAARQINDYLQFPSAGSRSTNERQPVENSTLDARTINGREIGGRNIEARMQ